MDKIPKIPLGRPVYILHNREIVSLKFSKMWRWEEGRSLGFWMFRLIFSIFFIKSLYFIEFIIRTCMYNNYVIFLLNLDGLPGKESWIVCVFWWWDYVVSWVLGYWTHWTCFCIKNILFIHVYFLFKLNYDYISILL